MSGPTDASAIATRQSLGHEIRAATRHYHTSLNRLITTRLPLCLPPHAHDASIYTYGITAFAELYFTFEHEWASIISSSPQTVDIPPRIQTLLRDLHNPSLLRSDRLKHDLSLLNKHQLINPSTLQSPSPPPLTSSIPTRINSHPHTLLAYPWILYLALFNGGRWIRSQLLSASTSTPNPSQAFWRPPHPAQAYLTFWHFESDSDGEDLKTEFKARFETVAAQLSDRERQEVVEEVARIFSMCEEVVRALDDRMIALQGDIDVEEKRERFSALAKLPLVSALTRQLYGVLAWMGMVQSGKVGTSAGHGMALREEVEVR